VVDVVRETTEATSFVLTDPTGRAIDFVAGQFFTVLVDLDGVTHRRAYSLSSDPRDTSRVRITVKRVAGGRVSNHLNDSTRTGDTLRVLGPSGHFTVEPEIAREHHYVLIGGGSGVTPLIAIARAILEGEPTSRLTLLFGNRAHADVIFHDEIAALARDHATRFTVRHLLESPPAAWTGGTGRLDRAVAGRELETLVPSHDACTFFVCGPEPMMNEVREALVARGVAADRIREERFTNPAARTEAPTSSRAQRVSFRLSKRGSTHDVIAAAGQTILEAGLGAGLDLDFSCAMGGCGACRVKRIEGEIEMEEPNCLTDTERAAGYVLACVGRAKSQCSVEIAR
jgi:ferredoxin-NADP reductase